MRVLRVPLPSGRWPLLLGFFLLAVGTLVWAQDSPPTAVSDAAYERYIDLALLSAAWEEKDAEMLTDVALQLAEGERVLLRPHKGITSDQVFAAAVRVGAERKNKAILARLTKILTTLGKAELAAEAKLAGQLADKSRAFDPALNVPVEGTTVEVFLLLKDTVEAIKSTKIARNAKGLEAIVKEIPKMTELSEGQRKALLKLAKEAQTNLPKDAKEVDPIADALDKLSDESRKPGAGAGKGGGGKGGAGGGAKGAGTKAGGAKGGAKGGGQGKASAPGRVSGMQGHWQRHFSHRHSRYHYWDPTYGVYYYYDEGCSCYLRLDGDD
jgi:hypothetical protein